MYYLVLVILCLIAGIDLHSFKYDVKRLVLMLVIVLIVIFDGLRNETGTDWLNYYNTFINKVAIFEFGYNEYFLLIRKFTSNYHIFLMITTTLIISLSYISIYKITNSFTSILIYYTSTIGILGANRQLLALGVSLVGIHFYLKNKYFLFLFLVMLASFLHNGALILLIYPIFYKIYSRIIIKNLFIKIIFIVGLVLLKLFLERMIENIHQLPILNEAVKYKIYYYLKDETTYSRVNMVFGILKNILILILIKIYLLKNNSDEKILKVEAGMVLGIVFYYLFYGIFQIIVARGNQYILTIFTSLLIGIALNRERKYMKKVIVYIFVILYSILTFEKGIGAYKDLYLPYKSIFYNKTLIRNLY